MAFTASNMAICMMAMPRAFGGGSMRFSTAIVSALAFQSLTASACAPNVVPRPISAPRQSADVQLGPSRKHGSLPIEFRRCSRVPICLLKGFQKLLPDPYGSLDFRSRRLC